MPKFLICFRVEQTLSGSIEVEAETAEEVTALFYHPKPWTDEKAQRVDDARGDAKLDLQHSADSIAQLAAAQATNPSLKSR